MEACSLASGSRGNSYYISSGGTEVLVDDGLSLADIENRLAMIGKRPENIKAIFLTHEHRDHLSGVVAFCLKYNAKFYVHKRAIRVISFMIEKIIKNVVLFGDEDFYFENFTVSTFALSHDSAHPIGFSFYSMGKKVTVLTDTGIVPQESLEAIIGSDLIFLESNHDVQMLLYGPYPARLKKRILSEQGHLSNDYSAEITSFLAQNGTKTVVLSHLSEKNNLPSKAIETAEKAISACGKTVHLFVAYQEKPTRIFEV